MGVFTTEKILEQFDDVGVLGTVLYADSNSIRDKAGYLYEDRECTNAVDKDTMYSLFLKGVYVKFLDPNAEAAARPLYCAKTSDIAMMVALVSSNSGFINFYSRGYKYPKPV